MAMEPADRESQSLSQSPTGGMNLNASLYQKIIREPLVKFGYKARKGRVPKINDKDSCWGRTVSLLKLTASPSIAVACLCRYLWVYYYCKDNLEEYLEIRSGLAHRTLHEPDGVFTLSTNRVNGINKHDSLSVRCATAILCAQVRVKQVSCKVSWSFRLVPNEECLTTEALHRGYVILYKECLALLRDFLVGFLAKVDPHASLQVAGVPLPDDESAGDWIRNYRDGIDENRDKAHDMGQVIDRMELLVKSLTTSMNLAENHLKKYPWYRDLLSIPLSEVKATMLLHHARIVKMRSVSDVRQWTLELIETSTIIMRAHQVCFHTRYSSDLLSTVIYQTQRFIFEVDKDVGDYELNWRVTNKTQTTLFESKRLQDKSIDDVTDLLISSHIDAWTAKFIALRIVPQGYSNATMIAKMNEKDLRSCGIRARAHINAILSLTGATNEQEEEYLFFISYVHIDTLAETVIVHEAAKAKFGSAVRIFRDSEERFELSDLVKRVGASKNVLIFLSPNYARSWYCLLELCTAIKSGAKILTVVVHKAGLGIFDFEKMNDMLKSGDVSDLLSNEEWDILEATQGFSQAIVLSSLRRVMGVKAFNFHGEFGWKNVD